MRTLKDVKVGEKTRVIKVHGQGALKRRIMDMGVTKLAPLGDPIEINVRGYELSLRKEDASLIEVE